jgi:ABC-2 type transport system permease protein
MRLISLIARRELRALFDAPVAYVATAASLLILLSLFTTEFFIAGRLDLNPLFRWLPAVAALLLPALAMRLWAEERRRRTFELWVTLPFTATELVLGKYLAGMGIWSLFLLGTTPAIALLFSLGDPDIGLICSGYLGALLLGSLLLSQALFLSSLTREVVVAFLTGCAGSVLLLASGAPRLVAVLDGLAPELAPGSALSEHLSALVRFDAFRDGFIGLGHCAWFIGTSLVFLAANAWAVRNIRD